MADQGGNYKVEKFPVYTPRALAGIGNRILDTTTRDRTFMIEMLRQRPEERREPFRLRHIGGEARTLKAEIEKWAKDHGNDVLIAYDKSDFRYLEVFRDRTIDIAQPLAAILEVAYKNHPGLERARLDLADAISSTRPGEESVGEEHRILQALEELARKEDPLVGNATELAEKCGQLGEKPDEGRVSLTLRRYGFETKSVRRDGNVRQRYSLPHEKLADLLSRYAPSGEPKEQLPETSTGAAKAVPQE